LLLSKSIGPLQSVILKYLLVRKHFLTFLIMKICISFALFSLNHFLVILLCGIFICGCNTFLPCILRITLCKWIWLIFIATHFNWIFYRSRKIFLFTCNAQGNSQLYRSWYDDSNRNNEYVISSTYLRNVYDCQVKRKK